MTEVVVVAEDGEITGEISSLTEIEAIILRKKKSTGRKML